MPFEYEAHILDKGISNKVDKAYLTHILSYAISDS
jgi:hypothetical protein